jgi:hypothetical protein
MYVVFLANKLISCDSIIPVMMEAHQRSDRRVEFYCFTPATFAGIRANVVLWDAIQSIGSLKQIGREERGFWHAITHRARSFWLIGRLALQALVRRIDFIHFRVLDNWPLRLLYYVNRNRTWAFEADSFGESEGMRRLADIRGIRKRLRGPPVGNAIVAFEANWEFLHHPETRGRPQYVFGPSRKRKVWLDFIRSRADAYFSEDFARSGHADNPEICVFMLSWFGPLDFMQQPDDTRTLFEEAIDVLAQECSDVPIFLKPHVITDMDVVRKAIGRHPEARFVISYLHPSVLASRAQFFVATYYSTTFGDAHILNVPTIEYTAYSDTALAATEGKSMFPEHTSYFINRDRAAFRTAIRACLDRPREPFPDGVTGDPSGLLDKLTGQ